MSKEIKEKCKLCVYYNDKQQYPDVEGATTHSNCLSLKCRYRKMTKDMQIGELKNKVSDLEAKLAEMAEKYNACQEARKLEIEFNQQDKAELKQQLSEKQKENEKLKTTNDRLYKKNKKLENQIVESNIRFYKKGSIEQLEKVSQEFSMRVGITDNNIDLLNEIIDNQIKQLKEGK